MSGQPGGTSPSTPQDNLVHLATGIQSRVASMHPEESRVAYHPAHSQQGLHYLQKSQSCTEFQHPKLEDRAFSLHSSDHQAIINASSSSSVQHKGISSPENFVRQSACKNGQQRESSNENFSQHFLKVSNLNNAELTQELEFAPVQGERTSGQMFSSEDQSSVSDSKVWTSSPLLCTVLRAESPDIKSLIETSSSSSDKICSNRELNVRDDFSDEKHCKNEEMRSSLASPNSELNKTQILDHSEGALSTPSQKVSPSSLRSQPSKGEVLEAGKARSMTNDQILDFIEKEVALLKSVSRKKVCYVDRQRFSSALNKLHTSATGHEEDDCLKGSKGTELSPNSKEKCDTSASEKHLTEHQHVMLEVAATCTKNEPESPLIVTAVSGVTLLEETEKYPRLTVSCSSSQAECKRVKETLGTPSLLSKHMRQDTVNQSEQPLCNQTSCKNMEEDAIGVCLQAGLSVSLPLNEVKVTPLFGNESKNTCVVAISNDPQYEDTPNAEDLSKLDINLPNTKQEEVRFADPSYEDISEGENPQFQNVVEEMPSLPCEVSEASTKQYERLQGQAKMNPDLKELIPKKQMSPKRETLGVALHCSCPCFVETEDGFEHVLCPKCDSDKHLGWQTNHSFSLLSVTQDRDETDEDDEWLVIPINMLDVKWEPANEDQADPEVSQDDVDDEEDVKQVYTNPPLYEVPRSASSPVPASAFSLMEVFDTPSHQVEAVQSREAALQSFLVPSSWGIPETKAHRPQNGESHCEPEEETEDSSDYSSDSEHNYLTVPRQLLKNLSAHVSPEKDNSDSEKENDHEVTNLQQCQTRGRSRSSKKDDIINLDSDTEDEGVQNCAETKTKRLFSTRKEDSGAVCLNQLKKCSPETVDSRCGTVKENSQTSELPSTASPASKRQSRCYKEVIKSENSDLRYRTEKCGHPLENKTVSQHVKKESSTQNVSNDPTVIVISDSEGEENQSNIQVKRKGVFSSESMSGGSTSHGEQRTSNEKRESAKTKNRGPSVSSADSKSQHQSKLQHMQSEEKRRDVHCSLTHSIKKRKLIKVRVRPENVHRKANRQITSKTVGRDIEKDFIKSKPSVVSSETEDSDDSLVDAQNSLCASKNPQISLSSKDSSEKLLQSVDREVDSTKVCHKHVQEKAERQMTSKTMGRDVEKDFNKQRIKTRVPSSETEDSDDILIYAQTSLPFKGSPEKQPQSVDGEVDSTKVRHKHVQEKANGHMTSKIVNRNVEKDLNRQRIKTRLLSSEMEDSDDTLIYAQTSPSSADMPEKHPETLNSENDSTLGPNVVVPRFFVQKSSHSSEQLKPLEQSAVQRQGKNETLKTPAETRKKTDSSKKKMQHLFKELKGKTVSKPKPASDVHLTAPLPRSMHSSSSPRQCLSSSKLQQSHSYSNTSTLNQSHILTKGPSLSTSTQPSAKEQVFNDWQTTFVPIRRDRKTSLESNLKTRNTCESLREARPGPSRHDKAPRRRHGSYESVPPLMKRPKYEAIQLTKARNRDTSTKIPCE